MSQAQGSANYRKKPVVIEAMRWNGEPERPGTSDVLIWMRNANCHVFVRGDGLLSIATLEGTTVASKGDWIIRGVKGEFYPCKPDIFEATYEAVTE